MNAITGSERSRDEHKLIAELNKKYGDRAVLPDDEPRHKLMRLSVRLAALLLAFIFFFSVTGRWLSVFSGPALHFLKESWALSSDPLVREARKAVVQVIAETGSGSTGGSLKGSGFNIDENGLVVTNRHLVENAARVRVSFPEHGLFIASKLYVSGVTDLALLQIEGENLPVIRLAAVNLTIGEEVILIGNPLQFTRIANKGKVVAYSKADKRELPHLVVEAMIYPGSSGSPVLNGRGEAGGIVFATLAGGDPNQAKGLAIDVGELIAILDSQLPE